MEPDVKAIGHYPRTFKEWGISITLIKTSTNAIYVPVKHLCEQLGLNANWQQQKLNADTDLAKGLADLPVPTPGGKQFMTCIRKREMAWWLVNIDDARCKPHIRGHLREVKQVLIEAAERILFGDIAHETDTHGIITISSRDEIIFSCLDCGAKHRLVIVNGEPIITLEREP